MDRHRRNASTSGVHLYHDNSCTGSQKVRLCLEHKGIQWTSHRIDTAQNENISAWFFKFNPAGTVPVLVHNGKVVCETFHIMEYIEKTFPVNSMQPSLKRHKLKALALLQLALKAEEPLQHLSLVFLQGSMAKMTDDVLQKLSHLSITDRRLFEKSMSHKHGFTIQENHSHIADVHRCFDLLENEIDQLPSSNILGNSITLADYAWAVNVHRAHMMGFPMHRYPRVRMWYHSIAASPIFQSAVCDYERDWSFWMCTVKVKLFDMLGKGITGFEEGVQTMWKLPIILMLITIAVYIVCPNYGLYFTLMDSVRRVSKALLLYLLLLLSALSVVVAYQMAHKTRGHWENPQPEANQEYLKAVVIGDYGDTKVIRLVHRHLKPKLRGMHDILVKVKSVVVSDSDLDISRGLGHVYYNSLRKQNGWAHGDGQEFPLVLGRGFCGVVEEIGERVTTISVGDEVYGARALHEQGAMAEWIVLRESSVVKKPNNVNTEEAASLPFATITAWKALAAGGIKPGYAGGKRVLVHGGAGSVGSMAIQLIKAWKGHVVATSSSDTQELVSSLGADRVIDYQTYDFAKLLSQESGFDLVLQTTSNTEVTERSMPHLLDGGVIVQLNDPMLELTSDYGMIVGKLLAGLKFLVKTSRKPYWRRHLRYVNFEADASVLQKITELVDNQQIRPIIEASFKFVEAHKAIDKVIQGHCKGRVVVNF